MKLVAKSAANHKGTLSSVKISVNNGEINIHTHYTVNENDEPKSSVDGGYQEPSFVSNVL